MNRPIHVWSFFAVALIVAVAALGWLTGTVLRVDHAATQAAAQAALEEDVRLALWRLDSNATTLVAQENARPYYAYRAVFSPDRPDNPLPIAPESTDDLTASPLVNRRPPHVRLHFQFDETGPATSPQVPHEALRAWVGLSLAPGEPLDFSAEEALLAEAETKIDKSRLCDALPPLDLATTIVLHPVNAPPTELPDVEQFDEQQAPFVAQAPNASRNGRMAQSRRSNDEFNQRSQNYQQMAIANNSIAQQQVDQPLASPKDVRVGLIKPLWIDGELFLARRALFHQHNMVQVCWIDWPGLRQSLLESIQDLLPGAALEPVLVNEPVGNTERMLASLPLRLAPRPRVISATRGLTAIEWALVAAWSCLGLAAIAVATLLSGVLALSERRGAFVSAVTHELRTPLTTFRMYAEMLASGMVPDEDRRHRYLETLRVEADRLSHLVENVLAYARLERGVSPSRLSPVSVGSLLDRAAGRLADRAEQAGMQFVVDAPEQVRDAHAQADSSAVEQILFNLVDNACKYGKWEIPKDEGRMTKEPCGVIHLQAEQRNGDVVLCVRDEGAGVAVGDRKRLFRPFSKSAHQAAVTAPGVGLGLALSRRLARQLGGDLRLAECPRGAAFELRLVRSEI